MKNFYTSFKFQLKELFRCSSIHGIKYITESDRSITEKLFWLCLVLFFAISSTVSISQLWKRFQNNPTITGLDTDFIAPTIPLPTIVVCPNVTYDDAAVSTNIETVTNHNKNFEQQHHSILKGLPSLNYKNFMELSKYTAKIGSNMTKYWDAKALREWTFLVKINCMDVFRTCSYKNEPESCCSMFKQVYTEQGFCYAFNTRYYGMEQSEEIAEDLKYVNAHELFHFLVFGLKVESRIFIHSLENVLTYDDVELFTWKPETSVDIIVDLKQTYTTDEAIELSMKQRKCIFEDERKVQIDYYNDKIYSHSFCMKECRMKWAIKYCNCIPPFYAPENIEKHSQCGVSDITCLTRFAKTILRSDCRQCLLSCNNQVFEPENFNKYRSGTELIKFTMNAIPALRYKREVVFGWIDLLVYAGGIFGLFMGLSLLSIVEFIYFLTIRVVFMVIYQKEKLKKLVEQEQKRILVEYNLRLWWRKRRNSIIMVAPRH